VVKRRRRAAAKPKPGVLLGGGPALTYDANDYERARRHLMADPLLAPIIAQTGTGRFPVFPDGDLFPSLVETIISQQLNIRVADVIYGRVCQLSPGGDHPTAAFLRDIDPALLRSAGLSQAKARSIQDLATKVCDGTLNLRGMAAMVDEEVERQLCQVNGIGPWSSHMFLIFRLNRPDIWPIGDLAIVRALQKLHGWKKVPARARLEQAGEAWRPYRSVASWYLWRSLAAVPPVANTVPTLTGAQGALAVPEAAAVAVGAPLGEEVDASAAQPE
jgi:3-methyladenine DNA glycosylase/8-oxoguanine DNA glycosylase